MRQALASFAVDVCNHYGHDVTVEDLAARGLPTAEESAGHETSDDRRAAFRDLAERLVSEFGIETDPMVLTRYRTLSMLDAGVLATGPDIDADEVVGGPPTRPDARFLDCEIIAIYW